MTSPRVRVLGYGNPGRQDDGVGPAIAEAVAAWGLPGVEAEVDFQLNIEDAADLARCDIVLFVDASIDAAAPFTLEKVRPASAVTFTSHTVSPASILAIAEDHFGARPEAWVMAVRGHAFEFEEGFTPEAQANCDAALAFVRSLLRTWKEHGMPALKKTILTIDDDPDIRATLRIVLEAEGFSVGEAATGEEGVKVAERINPDAIIIDLMMENVDSGTSAARTLKDQGFDGPIYMLSSAGDTVRYNLDARDLGLAGIFQKPIDPKTLVTTLKAKLKTD